MKKNGIASYLFAFLAALFAVTAMGLAFFCRDRTPLLGPGTEAAAEQVCILMDAVCSGDFEAAEKLLYGNPELGADRAPADAAGRMIWQAYVESLDYQLSGDVYATDTGVAQDVKIISMEISTVTAQLASRTGTLLNEKMEAAEDVSELYDENNEYRDDLVAGILEEAVRQALEEDVRYSYRIVPLQLVYAEDRWQVVADPEFLQAVSGGIAG